MYSTYFIATYIQRSQSVESSQTGSLTIPVMWRMVMSFVMKFEIIGECKPTSTVYHMGTLKSETIHQDNQGGGYSV